MLITQKEYAEKHGISFAAVRAAVQRGALPHAVDETGRRLVDSDDPWHAKYRKRSELRGVSYTRLYCIHHGMRHRCSSPYASGYKNYGGRGISVCEEWDKSFSAFYEWAMSHGYREGLQIDRIDNDGNYEPSNCRWVTPKENTQNRRKRQPKKYPHPPFFIPLDVPDVIKCVSEDDYFITFHDVGDKILKRFVYRDTEISTWSTATEADFEEYFSKK